MSSFKDYQLVPSFTGGSGSTSGLWLAFTASVFTESLIILLETVVVCAASPLKSAVSSSCLQEVKLSDITAMAAIVNNFFIIEL